MNGMPAPKRIPLCLDKMSSNALGVGVVPDTGGAGGAGILITDGGALAPGGNALVGGAGSACCGAGSLACGAGN